MPFVPARWSAADVEHELLDPPRRAWAPFPGLEVIDRPDWTQLTCRHFPRGGLNEVCRAKLTDTNAEEIIEQTQAHYANRGLAFRWSVTPDSTPLDLAQRLAKRGLVSKQLVAMARSTQTSEDTTGFEIITADTDLFTEVMCEGWGAPVGAMADYNRACAQDPRFGFFVAKAEGEPAGAGGAVFFERSVYLLGGVVLPRFRRRGVYRVLTTARLAAARVRGLELATTRAMAETSAPLLEGQGWDAWFTFPSFSPPKV